MNSDKNIHNYHTGGYILSNTGEKPQNVEPGFFNSTSNCFSVLPTKPEEKKNKDHYLIFGIYLVYLRDFY
jgi:hypothetical protein